MYLQAKRLLKLALSPVLMLLSLFSAGAWAEAGERWQTNMAPVLPRLVIKFTICICGFSTFVS